MSIEMYVSHNSKVNSKDVEFVVFPCSNFEIDTLIEQVENEDLVVRRPRMTQSFHVGDLLDIEGNKLHIFVNISCFKISGRFVAFVEPHSDVSVRSIVDEWLKLHFVATWGEDARRAICNPENFHLCLLAIHQPRPVDVK